MTTQIVLTGTKKATFAHVEGEHTQLTTGGDGLGFDGWTIGTEATPVPAEAVEAFGVLAEAQAETFEVRDDR